MENENYKKETTVPDTSVGADEGQPLHNSTENSIAFGDCFSRFPLLIQPVWIRPAAPQAAPVKEHLSFEARIVFPKVPCFPPFTQSILKRQVEAYTYPFAITQPAVAVVIFVKFSAAAAEVAILRYCL